MKKAQELTDPASCLMKAGYDETLFVLMARDQAAPATIRFWMDERIRLDLNQPNDAQIHEAADCARAMEKERFLAKVTAIAKPAQPIGASAAGMLAQMHAELGKAQQFLRAFVQRAGSPDLCKGCAEQIFWVKHRDTGKNVPYDPDGTNHFATCPVAKQFRKDPKHATAATRNHGSATTTA
jgi:hypothetical protein